MPGHVWADGLEQSGGAQEIVQSLFQAQSPQKQHRSPDVFGPQRARRCALVVRAGLMNPRVWCNHGVRNGHPVCARRQGLEGVHPSRAQSDHGTRALKEVRKPLLCVSATGCMPIRQGPIVDVHNVGHTQRWQGQAQEPLAPKAAPCSHVQVGRLQATTGGQRPNPPQGFQVGHDSPAPGSCHPRGHHHQAPSAGQGAAQYQLNDAADAARC